MLAHKNHRSGWAPIILAVLATFLAAHPAQAAEARLQQVNDRIVEISGGSGREAWRLRYGIFLERVEYKPLLVPAEGDRAWYAYGGWLRLIDTQKGQILGRWHFPTMITNLRPQGVAVDVEIREKVWDWKPKGNRMQTTDRYVTRHVLFDPVSPHVPFWPDGNLMRYHIPHAEVANVFESRDFYLDTSHPKTSAEQAKKILPELEDAVRRDPFTPWLGIALGKLLRDIGDPRAPKVYQDALNSPGADFTDLLPVSGFLDGLGEREQARTAFERGYQDFWTKGNDPRLFLVLLGQLMLYRLPRNVPNDPGTESGREFVERTYRLIPYGEGAELAWRLYADYWKQKGQNDQARLWQARFEDARRNSGFNWIGREGSEDRAVLVGDAAFLAIALYWLVLFLRYRPQRRLDQAVGQRVGALSRGFVFFNTQYWSRAERFAFFIMAFILWVAIGLFGQGLQSIVRRASTPISAVMGNLGGPENVNMLETDLLPPSPYHDLLLAFAYQEDGQTEKAEGLYRKLPQFAESWNNLGVILRSAGKDQEAKQAFEKALELDPTLSEPAFNLGRPPTDLWAEMHQKYLPGQPMLAPPRGVLWDRVFLGGSPAKIYLRALLGPFAVQDPSGLLGLVGRLFG
jgi:tetratricopeptide (TPR) repeat protein